MEALANLSQFGVCELREDELILVDGGWCWKKFGKEVAAGAIVGACVGAASGIGTGAGALTGGLTGALHYATMEVFNTAFGN
jgi:hypothetical protein